MRKILSLVVVLLISMFFIGCSTRITDFTVISTKNVDLSKAASFKKEKVRVKGGHMPWDILIIPTGIPNLKTAIDRTIEKNPKSVALVDGVVYYKWWSCILFGRSGYVVEGTQLLDDGEEVK
jgi:hypothetical protein